MPWLKLLHITAVILWCGTLLYLPAALAASASAATGDVPTDTRHRLLRLIYTLVTTPAALVAIASGTAIFVFQDVVAVWLMAKLGVVGLLVLGHGACGLLVLRVERGEYRWTRGSSWVIAATTVIWIAAIAWLVLEKPQ
ncbi:MAG: CopD family protein [Hydrogenophaga sp.]|nr:CopD family protein [Hydrogenophaga sp.]